MPAERSAEFRFWLSVAARVLVIVLAGLGEILLFRGCVAPGIQDKIAEDQQRAAEVGLPR
jgi:hypothetical protein